jgi:hypothetical protein
MVAGTSLVLADPSLRVTASSFTNGTSFTSRTVSANTKLELAALPSVAVMRSSTLPTSALVGTPPSVAAAASKLSHAGSAPPLARVSERPSGSPASTSTKVPGGSV